MISFFLGELRALLALLLGLALLHDLDMGLLEVVADALGQLDDEDDLVVLDLAEHPAGHRVRDVVVFEVVLGDLGVVGQHTLQLVDDAPLQRVHLLGVIVDEVEPRVGQVQLLQPVPARVHRPDHLVEALVHQRVALQLQGPQLRVQVGQDLLYELRPLARDVAVAQGQLLYPVVGAQPLGQDGQPLQPYFVVVQPELHYLVGRVEQDLGQELTTQLGDVVFHQVQVLHGVALGNEVADGPQALVLQVGLPDAHLLQVLVIEVGEPVHEGPGADRPHFTPHLHHLQLSIFDRLVDFVLEQLHRHHPICLALLSIYVGYFEGGFVLLSLRRFLSCHVYFLFLIFIDDRKNRKNKQKQYITCFSIQPRVELV